MSLRPWRWVVALTLTAGLASAQGAPAGPPEDPRRVEREAAWWRRKGEALRRAAVEARADAARRAGPPRDALHQLAARRDLAADGAYAEAVRGYDRLLVAEGSICARRAERAAALFGGRRYEDAARAYALLRDERACGAGLPLYALMAVRALEAQLVTDARARRLDACDAVRAGADPGALVDAAGASPLDAEAAAECQGPSMEDAERAIPPVVMQLLEARIAYANRLSRSVDGAALRAEVLARGVDGRPLAAPSRATSALDNARTLVRFGHVREGEHLLRAILYRYCDDAPVREGAARELLSLLDAPGRETERQAVADESRRACPPSYNPALGPISSNPFRRPVEILRRAERAERELAPPLYEEAASALEAAVAENARHPLAPLALCYAAAAWEDAHRPAAAVRVFRSVLSTYDVATPDASGGALNAEERADRLHILASARQRVAVNLERATSYDEALAQTRRVVTDALALQPESTDQLQRDALQRILRLTAGRGRWDEAAAALADVVTHARDAGLREDAAFERARLPYLAGRWREAARSLGAWLQAPGPPRDVRRHLQALREIARSHLGLGDRAAYLRAMREVERVFRERRLALDGPAAPFVAEAVFVELDERVGALLRAPPDPAEVLRARLDAIDRALWAVERVRDAHVVASSYRVGQAFEHAAERLRDASLRRRAIERYAGAVHAAQSSGAPSLFADAALSRLREIDTRAAVDAVIRAQAAPSLDPRALRRASAGAALLESSFLYTTPLAR